MKNVLLVALSLLSCYLSIALVKERHNVRLLKNEIKEFYLPEVESLNISQKR